MGQKVEVYNPDGSLLRVEDTRTLGETKDQMKALVNQIRKDKISAGYTWNGNIWDIDSESMSILSNYCSAISNGIELPDGFTWRSKENINVPMTEVELSQLNAILINQINAIYNYSWQLKETIDGISELAELDSFDVFIGWP